jgi:hypothetical protein
MEVKVQNMTSMVSVNRCRVTDDCNPEAWLSGDTIEALLMIYIYVLLSITGAESCVLGLSPSTITDSRSYAKYLFIHILLCVYIM